ncbi:cation diffusion facilitator family transporter [Pseudoalteromonas sp. S16_S37]|uniref:cation diffusion facilitator family transporter n=1 Tax=Pseudoalteromonas sp. S16_S37 TaxID=2720228 RepID=UPI0016810008|nr:cation diffusion facilitator family transporter [Pseudoalteromonas sp. S16_S37]MBD1583768.1 cation transporter [Pseudoalteromonas sp. S16_S37]
MTDITTHQDSRRRLLLALAITCSFMVIQLIGAYYANSLAVLADAGHLFVHNSSLFIAVIASSIAVYLAKTFNDGYKKAEYVGGLINGILYLAISVLIIVEGAQRFVHHNDGHQLEVNSYLMSVIASIGFLFHGLSTWVLYKGRKDSINVYAVFLHSFFDLLSTVSTFLAGVMIYVTGWEIIDVISSLLISMFVLLTGIKVVRSCINGLFFARIVLPKIAHVEKEILKTEHVENVHNITVSEVDGMLAIGAHIVLKHHCTIELHDASCRVQVENVLKNRFNAKQCVLQIESHQCPNH